MSKGYRAEDYQITKASVQFETDKPELRWLFERCEAHCVENQAVFNDKKVLREGSIYDGVWAETQPMGGEMYAKRDIACALNNQLIFMEHQRKDGRLPGTIFYGDFLGVQVCYDWMGFCFALPAFKMFFLAGHDKGYLKLLYQCLRDFDGYLWKYRDSNGDGCLETWCTWDTGEDNATRFTELGVPDGRCGGEHAPLGIGKLPYASMDVMSYSCQARAVLADISDILQNQEGDLWRQRAKEVRDKIRSYLWIEEKNACYDRDCENQIMDILLHNNLRCMYFGAFDQDMADRFLKYHLFNSEEFWTPIPLPSVAANDAMFRNENSNSWSGAVQGLTYQRAIQALELYGHMAEIRILGKKWIQLLCDKKHLVQQYDPFDGTPCVDHTGNIAPDGYGPTILAALEYLALLCGVRVAVDQVEFSAVRDWHNGIYQQEMLGHLYQLRVQNNRMTALMDGEELFTADCGVSITTDMEGNIQWIWGIEEQKQTIQIQCVGETFCGEIFPNQQVRCEKGGFTECKHIAFDFPFMSNPKQ